MKPANIKVRPDGTVKVLDFGLAKALEPMPGGRSDVTASPTITTPAMTGMGMILGTAAYMSPEQAKGRPADKCSDVWAFGCVLYEMLTDKRAFQGDDVSDTLAAVLRGEPDWTALPPNLPSSICTLVKRCLEKDRRQRIADISIALFLVDEQTSIEQSATADAGTAAPPLLWKRAIPAAVSAVVAAALAGTAVWYLRPSQEPRAVTRFTVTVPNGQLSNTLRQQLAISPDGSQLVYLSNNQLYLRTLSEVAVGPVQGVPSGSQSPVFSPDSRFIAFAAPDGTLKKIAVGGGAAVTICQAHNPFGISWSSEGILFGEAANIVRVTETGGTPEPLVSVKDGLFYGPQMLPGGQAVLFTQATSTGGNQWDQAKIVVQSLRSGKQETLINGGSDGRYLPSGHLVYALGGTLFAVAFDPQRLEVKGVAVPVLEGVRRSSGNTTGATHFSVSNTGSLAYIPGPASTTGQLDLALTDRKGGIERLKLPPGPYEYPRVSPDGQHIALQTDDGKESVVWVYDLLGSNSIRRLTFGGRNRFPIWSADGQRVAFQSDREGDSAIWWQRADGAGPAERLTRAEPGTAHVPDAWSPKSDQFLFDVTKAANVSLWTFSLQDKKMTPFGGVQATAASPTTAVFSPDGRWVAYSSDEHGVMKGVYVQPFPPTGARYQIFSKPGDDPHHPLWSPDGKELLYIPRGGGFEAVSVSTIPTLEFGNPVPVPRSFPTAAPTTPRTFDITPDGKIVGVVSHGEAQGPPGAPQIEIVLNWTEELKARVPTK